MALGVCLGNHGQVAAQALQGCLEQVLTDRLRKTHLWRPDIRRGSTAAVSGIQGRYRRAAPVNFVHGGEVWNESQEYAVKVLTIENVDLDLVSL